LFNVCGTLVDSEPHTVLSVNTLYADAKVA